MNLFNVVAIVFGALVIVAEILITISVWKLQEEAQRLKTEQRKIRGLLEQQLIAVNLSWEGITPHFKKINYPEFYKQFNLLVEYLKLEFGIPEQVCRIVNKENEITKKQKGE